VQHLSSVDCSSSYMIYMFTGNYNLWHYVKNVIDFIVDELMNDCAPSTSKSIFLLGITVGS
jgi:hypothetical protein